MKRIAIAIAAALVAIPATLDACTNLIVTSGASADGSVMITYTCDGEFHPRMSYTPPADHAPGDSLELRGWGGTLMGKIAQVPHTYGVVQLMNEHQLVIGETTFTGREELRDPDGILHYWWLMRIALQRCRTAREAVETMGALVEEYGYASTGESISIGDPKEAWLFEISGKGPGRRGAVWVAVRIPDGTICAHANQSVIREFPLHDGKNCLYAPDVIDFAIEKGYYDPASGKPFSFSDAYCPAPPQKRRYCATRVWSLFRRAAPSREFSPDYHRGVKDAEPYPLWIEPDGKLTRDDVFALMRDHYEGTPYDATDGYKTGTPNHTKFRTICTASTINAFVVSLDAKRPEPLAASIWLAMGKPDTTVFLPLYYGVETLPPGAGTGGNTHDYALFAKQHFEDADIKAAKADLIHTKVLELEKIAEADYGPMHQTLEKELFPAERAFIESRPAFEKEFAALYAKDKAKALKKLDAYVAAAFESVAKVTDKLIAEASAK